MVILRIDYYIPEFDWVERHKTVINAPPEVVYAELWKMDFGRSSVIRTLFRIRELYGKLVNWLLTKHSAEGPRRLGLSLKELTEQTNFILLDDIFAKEIVIGLIGRFWMPTGDLIKVPPEQFKDYKESGYAKAVWSFSIEDEGNGYTVLSTETRVRSINRKGKSALRIYMLIIGPYSSMTRRVMLRLVRKQAESSS